MIVNPSEILGSVFEAFVLPPLGVKIQNNVSKIQNLLIWLLGLNSESGRKSGINLFCSELA